MTTNHIVRMAAFWIAMATFAVRLLVPEWQTQARYVFWAAMTVWIVSFAKERLSGGAAKRT